MNQIKESELRVGDFIHVNGRNMEVTHISNGQVNFRGADYENGAIARHNIKRLGIQCYTRRPIELKSTFGAYVTCDAQLKLPMEMMEWLLDHATGKRVKITVETVD